MRHHLSALGLLLTLSTPVIAQVPSAPVWSGHEVETVYLAPTFRTCHEGNIYSLETSEKEHTFSVFQPAGTLVKKTLPRKGPKNHVDINAMTIVGGQPCIVFDEWDVKTGELNVFVQRYTTELEIDGAAVPLGKIPLDPKSYAGWQLVFDVMRSPDGSKNLFLFDRLQSGGIKLAMCWVTDDDLDILWKGIYRIPVQAVGSESDVWLMDNGHVIMRMSAVVLEQEDVKEKKDGTLKVKDVQNPYKHSSTSWYEMFGETFNKWSEDLADDSESNYRPLQVGDKVVLAGVRRTGPRKSPDLQWVLLEVKDGFDPKPLQNGTLKVDPKNFEWNVRAALDKQGAVYITMKQEEGVYMVKVDPARGLEWERNLNWDETAFSALGDRMASLTTLSKDQLEKLEAGRPWRPAIGNFTLTPLLLSVDPDGQNRTMRVLPIAEQEVQKHWSYNNNIFRECGCYISGSHSKKRKGMVRVDFTD